MQPDNSLETTAAVDVKTEGSSPPPPETSLWSRMAAPIVVGSLFALLLILGGVISAKKRRALAERESEAKAERPAVSVVVIELESQTFVDEVSLPGVVDPWKDVWVAAQVAGIVVGVSVVEGDTVARGAPLCRIDDRDYVAALAGADAGADAANSAVGLAALQFERMAKLRRDGTVGQAEYDAAEAAVRQARASFRQAMAASAGAKLALERTVIRAPMTGFVSRLPATVGILLSPGARVARIVDTTKVRVNIGIPERDLLAVGGQKKVDLTFSAIPDHKYVGKRIYLGIEPEDRSRTYKMQLAIDNRDGALRPGMFAKGRIIRGKPRDAILVPLFAVIPRAKDKIVFVEEDGVARRRIVETGVLQGKKLREARVEITGGLAPGDRLIVVGHRQVEDGDRVTITEMPSGLRDLMQ